MCRFALHEVRQGLTSCVCAGVQAYRQGDYQAAFDLYNQLLDTAEPVRSFHFHLHLHQESLVWCAIGVDIISWHGVSYTRCACSLRRMLFVRKDRGKKDGRTDRCRQCPPRGLVQACMMVIATSPSRL